MHKPINFVLMIQIVFLTMETNLVAHKSMLKQEGYLKVAKIVITGQQSMLIKVR